MPLLAYLSIYHPYSLTTKRIASCQDLPVFLFTGGQDIQIAWNVFADFTTAPVPEPETWALMGLGLIGTFSVSRRRRNVAERG